MALNAVIKPQILASTAVTIVEQTLIVPNLFTKVGVDEFKGAYNDTINVKVPGVLPAHDMPWRVERTTDVTFDYYAERSFQVSFQGDVYSATRLQDEQVDFDGLNWPRLVATQAEAVARNIEGKAIVELGAPHFPGNTSLASVSGTSGAYSYLVAGAKSGRNLRTTLLNLRRVANAIKMAPNRTLLVGVGIEQTILSDATYLGLASAMVGGESVSVPALRSASIGRLFGMNVVVAQELPANVGYLITPGAYIMAMASPYAPASVPFAATASARGVSVRWMRDYDPARFVDRSVVNTYVGFRAVPDVVFMREANTVSTAEYFIRAIALDMTATADVLPAAGSDLDRAFHINATDGLA